MLAASNCCATGMIDQRGFDALMERLLTEDTTFVVDNGAATFIPLWNYYPRKQRR